MSADFEFIDRLIDDPKAIIYIRDMDGRYVWVNDTYGEELPHSNEEVIGKTNRELHGAGARNWEIADSLVGITGNPVTTTEEMWDDRSGYNRWRKFVSTKLRISIGGISYIAGISVEVVGSSVTDYELKLGRLRARLIEQLNELS